MEFVTASLEDNSPLRLGVVQEHQAVTIHFPNQSDYLHVIAELFHQEHAGCMPPGKGRTWNIAS